MPEDVPNSTEPPRGPSPTPDAPDRVQEKPLKPAHDPSDDKNPNKNPNDPSPLDPALLPIGDPAGAA